MSYLVKKIDVRGFQHSRHIEVALHPDVNFIIGRNGTGKTTFIRLLSACLSLDFEELSQLPFQTVTISFDDSERGLTPTLKIDRDEEHKAVFSVQFRNSGNQSYHSYFVDDGDHFASPYASRALRRASARLLSRQRDASQNSVESTSSLRKLLRKELQFSWLPLLRSRAVSSDRYELYGAEYSDEPINRKLRELLGATTSYLSSLESRVANATSDFQRDVFVSYLEKNTFSPKFLRDLDIKDEQKHLNAMFVEMGYPSADLQGKLDEYSSRTRATKSKVEEGGLAFEDIVTIVSATALHRIVSSFQAYTKIKEGILQPRAQFLQILNDMLYRKRVFFDSGNVLNVQEWVGNNQSPPRKLDVYDLSSGEKQLLVILSEALLQQQRSYVFMADEPELSLHVDWQERLVRIIREMNDRAQIIFATHSPDIVSIYQDHVIDFEKL